MNIKKIKLLGKLYDEDTESIDLSDLNIIEIIE